MWLVNVRIVTAVVDVTGAVAAVLQCEEVVVMEIVEEVTEIVVTTTVLVGEEEEMTVEVIEVEEEIATVETEVLIVDVPRAVDRVLLLRHHVMVVVDTVTAVRRAVVVAIMMASALTIIRLAVVLVAAVRVEVEWTGAWIVVVVVGPVDLVLRTIGTVIDAAAVLMRRPPTVVETGPLIATAGTLDLKFIIIIALKYWWTCVQVYIILLAQKRQSVGHYIYG